MSRGQNTGNRSMGRGQVRGRCMRRRQCINFEDDTTQNVGRDYRQSNGNGRGLASR